MYETKNVAWHKDDLGWYWCGDLYRDGKKIGLTGNYYMTDERLDVCPAM